MLNRATSTVTPPPAPHWFPANLAFVWRLGYDQGRRDTQEDIAIDMGKTEN